MKCKGGFGSSPFFNFEGERKSLYCTKCKKDGMVNVVSAKCKSGCGAQPSFNLEGQSRPLYCTRCKRDGMVNIK
eukprot:Pgem_evm2s9434